MYYLATNRYSWDNQVGFSNTWNVLAFETKALRQQWLTRYEDRHGEQIGVCPIKKREIGKYIRRPKPFSGECWAVDTDCSTPFLEDEELVLGYVNRIHSLDLDKTCRRVYKS